jgi:hypothetical protein
MERARPVDTVVREYNLGILDASLIALEINRVRPNIPIVMLAEPEESRAWRNLGRVNTRTTRTAEEQIMPLGETVQF